MLPTHGEVVRPKRKQLNRKMIASNLAEAIEELEGLHEHALNGKLNKGEFQVGLLHAYRHLNFAWNIRHLTLSQYVKMTQRQFKRWGTYPSQIEKL